MGLDTVRDDLEASVVRRPGNAGDGMPIVDNAGFVRMGAFAACTSAKGTGAGEPGVPSIQVLD